jgi:alpha-tubulin suppressor-like RCC1 family protein
MNSITSINDIQKISCGNLHSFVINNDGNAYSFGINVVKYILIFRMES